MQRFWPVSLLNLISWRLPLIASVVMVALIGCSCRFLRHGRTGTLAGLARVPGEGQDVFGLARSHDRMLSVATGSGNNKHLLNLWFIKAKIVVNHFRFNDYPKLFNLVTSTGGLIDICWSRNSPNSSIINLI